MKILITGSAGNVGRKLVPYLRSCRHDIYEYDQVQNFREKYFVGNILSPSDLQRVFMKVQPNIVFHLAAMVSRVTCEASPGLTIDTNLVGLTNVVQLCKTFQVKLIYFSTSEVYGNIGGLLSEDIECKPNNIYGLTKYLGEKLVEYMLGENVIIPRLFMIYDEDEVIGNHRSAMIRFAYHLLRGEKITVHKNSSRAWLHISDAVKILEKLIYVDKFSIINIGSNEIIATEDLVNRMCQVLGIEYSDYVIEEPLPEKMTLEKHTDLRKQFELTKIELIVNIDQGIELVLSKVKERCQQ